jgi:alkanesulfonate monooxygenase SsuD/methylene tetrahydromethanopterin reductase-like flavin-dependent oxidoreductase (luciferase family)
VGEQMRVGIFHAPYNAPERTPYEVTEWVLDVIRWADELGFAEAWIAEHFTIGWEPIPAPDLLIASALRETSQIKLAPGAHLLPYHHPVALAHRIAWLDHMAQGRYMLGIGAGAFALDHQLFATTAERNAEMMVESLDILQAIWAADGPFRFEGRFWTVDYPERSQLERGPHLKPFQVPHPPIAIAGTQPASPTLAFGGRRNLEPMSIVLNPAYLASHWAAYSEAALDAGHVADRRRWRIAAEFMVADTDAEAIALIENGFIGRFAREYQIPLFKHLGRLSSLAPGASPDEVTPTWLAQHNWLVGSPETVIGRIRELYDATGGFGTLLFQASDYRDTPDAYRHCLELVASEVMPAIADLEPGPPAAG